MNKYIIVLLLFFTVSCTDESVKTKNTVGFIVTEECLEDVESISKEYMPYENIDFVTKEFPVNNNEGGFHVLGKKYVELSSSSYPKSKLIGYMNGFLANCGLDSYVSFDLSAHNSGQKLNTLFNHLLSNKELFNKSIYFELKGTELIMYQNNKKPIF